MLLQSIPFTTTLMALSLLATRIATPPLGAGTNKLIIDVDPGVDDIEALTIFVNMHKRRTLDILAIVITQGNVDQMYCIRNALRLLQAANSVDIPVYAGSPRPILPHQEQQEKYFGQDGFCDLPWSTQPFLRQMKHTVASTAVSELVNEYPNQITYIALGPLTNLALAIIMYDGFAAKLRGVYAMGGLHRNGAKVAEFNIGFDPESAEVVFDGLQSPMSIFTWQACLHNAPLRGWCENKNINNPVYNMIQRAEVALTEKYSGKSWENCDAMAAIAFLDESVILASYESPLQVQLDRSANYSRGVITNYTNVDNRGSPRLPVRVITEIDMDLMQNEFLEHIILVCPLESSCSPVY